jgi:hypothetical protein
MEAQLAHRKRAESDAISETVTTPASAIELIPASTLPPVEKVYVEAETAEPVEAVPELQLRKVEQVDRKMLGKVKRAFVKAGVEAGPEAQAAFLNDFYWRKFRVKPFLGSHRPSGKRRANRRELVASPGPYEIGVEYPP